MMRAFWIGGLLTVALFSLFIAAAAYDRGTEAELLLTPAACTSSAQFGIHVTPLADGGCRVQAFTQSLRWGRRIELEQDAGPVHIPQEHVLSSRPVVIDTPLSGARKTQRDISLWVCGLALLICCFLVIDLWIRRKKKPCSD